MIVALVTCFTLTSVFADDTEENRQACYNYLKEYYKDLDIFPNDYYILRNNLDSTSYTPMKRTWTNLNFVEPFVFVKLYHFGERSSFVYDYREYEKSKFGSMQWPNNHEFQYFEQYSIHPNSTEYEFEGCGIVNMKPVGDYTLNTVTNEDNYFLNVFEWKYDVDEEDPYSLSIEKVSKQLNIDMEESIEWHSTSYYINNYDAFFNEYKMFFDYAFAIDQFKRGERYYWQSFEEKMYWKYPELRPYLRYGSVYAKTFFEDVPKVEYFKLKELLLTFIPINEQTKYLRDREGIGISYAHEVFTYLNITETDDMVQGMIAIDRGSDPEIYFNMIAACETEVDYNCIGKGLTNYYSSLTNNVHSVNVMVELYMEENYWYNLSDLDTIQKVIENEVYLFGEDLEKTIEKVNNNWDNSKEIVYVEVPVENSSTARSDSIAMFFVMVVLIVIVVSLIIVSSKKS